MMLDHSDCKMQDKGCGLDGYTLHMTATPTVALVIVKTKFICGLVEVLQGVCKGRVSYGFLL